MVEARFPLAEFSECSVKAGRLDEGIEALQKHLALLRKAERTVRERAVALEAQGLPPDDPRLYESSTVLKHCADQESKSEQRLVELMLKRDGGENGSRD